MVGHSIKRRISDTVYCEGGLYLTECTKHIPIRYYCSFLVS